MSTRALRLLPAASAVAATLGAAMATGCGDEDTPKAATLRVSVSEPSPGRFSYSAARTVSAGVVKIVLRNRGKKPHKAQLWRIQGAHSLREALRARRPLPDWLFYEGGVAITKPGAAASVVQRLRPGRYYIADSGGAKGRVAPFRVVGDGGGGELPEAPARIIAKDYSFVASGLKAGTNRIEFSDEGFEPHHVVFAPVKGGGSSVGTLRRFLRGSGPIPVGDVVDLDRAEESAVIEQGQKQVLDLPLKRGSYALLCFVPDRKGGPAHVVKGMVDQVTVR